MLHGAVGAEVRKKNKQRVSLYQKGEHQDGILTTELLIAHRKLYVIERFLKAVVDCCVLIGMVSIAR